MFTEDDIHHFFTYHPPTPDRVEAYNELRKSAESFALTIFRYVPPGADKSAAIRKVREAVMTANAGIACAD